MKIGPLEISGSLVLLACMVFALAKLESADRWVTVWVPFVAAGVMLIIGLIEGIVYLCKPDDEFVRVYVDARKEWF